MADKIKEKNIEQKLESDAYYQASIPSGGDTQCPECQSKKITACNVKDVAFSIHYVDDTANFTCHNCSYEWNGQYGYREIA